jgi:hypothetical protein
MSSLSHSSGPTEYQLKIQRQIRYALVLCTKFMKWTCTTRNTLCQGNLILVYIGEYNFRLCQLYSDPFYLQCPRSLEPMGILIIGSMTCFLIDGLGGRPSVVGHHDHLTLTPSTLHFGDSWKHRCMLLKSEIFVTFGRELQTVVLLSIPICWAKSAWTW